MKQIERENIKIEDMIYEKRGKQVMFDWDVVRLLVLCCYKVENIFSKYDDFGIVKINSVVILKELKTKLYFL